MRRRTEFFPGAWMKYDPEALFFQGQEEAEKKSFLAVLSLTTEFLRIQL